MSLEKGHRPTKLVIALIPINRFDAQSGQQDIRVRSVVSLSTAGSSKKCHFKRLHFFVSFSLPFEESIQVENTLVDPKTQKKKCATVKLDSADRRPSATDSVSNKNSRWITE